MSYGHVRFFIPNGTYSGEAPKDIQHDLVAFREWRNRGVCCKWTRTGNHCHNRAHTFTNGQWTCKRHVSMTPDHNRIATQFSVGGECSICLQAMETIEDGCVTSCSHQFHKKCLLTWVERFERTSHVCDFTCPLCRNELRIGGLSTPSDMGRSRAYILQLEEDIMRLQQMIDQVQRATSRTAPV